MIIYLFHNHFFLTIAFLALCSSFSTCIKEGAINDGDRASLSLFNLSISAAPPLNWPLSVDFCAWEGIGCNDYGRVSTLLLPSRGLTGRLSPYIANLTDLTRLDLSHNNLTGEIPQDIGKLSILEQLQLFDNKFTGTIPGSLKNCTNLQVLNLRFNLLKGELSAFDFSKFVRLRVIDLGFNFFTGDVSQSLFSCKTLAAIRLSYNSFGGEIPTGIANLQSLSYLSLAYNNLTNIRNALRILNRCKNLRLLALVHNFYAEELPQESIIAPQGYRNLQVLTLADCGLTGTIPQWLSKLVSIGFLDLSRNSITGSIPGWMGAFSNLFHLDLSSNDLSGQFPLELTRLRGLPADAASTSDLCANSTFELPVIVPSSSSSLQYNRLCSMPPGLLLGNNRISGEIPADIGGMKFLTIIDLKHNNFSGGIPDTLYELTNLQRLDLSGNHLWGEIPTSLKNLHFLSAFNVSFNGLHGRIPTGHQFDTFEISSYEGNPGLCGGVIGRACPSNPADDDKPGKVVVEHQPADWFNWLGFEVGYTLSLILTVILVFQDLPGVNLTIF